MSGVSREICLSNLKSVALTVLELLAFNAQKFRGSRDHGHAHFRDCSHDDKGKLYSKFGEDRSRTELTMLIVIAVWTDGRTDAKVALYSVQCSTLHWTDNNIHIENGGY